MIQEAIHKVINRQDRTYEEAVEVMGEIMSGEATRSRWPLSSQHSA